MYYLEGTIINIKHNKGGVSRKTGETYDSFDQIQIQHQTENNGTIDIQIENIKTRSPEKVRPYLNKTVFLPISLTKSASGTYINHIENADIKQVVPKPAA